MLIPRRSVRTSQPQYAVGINWSNSLSRGITSVYLPSVGVSLICSGPTTQGGTSRVTANSGVGRRFQGGVSTDFIGYGTADSLFGQNRADGSIVSLLRYTDTTLRDAQLFGQSSDGGASNRILVQHWSDGKIYFDWGGATNGAGRISATVSKTLNPFVISAISSASSGKKLWIDKQKVAENGADFTAFPSSSAVFRLGNIYSTWISDACEIYLAVTWNRPLSDLEYKSFVDNPWQIFEDEEEFVFRASAVGGSSLNAAASGSDTASGSGTLATQVALAGIGLSVVSGSAARSVSIPASAAGLDIAGGGANAQATITIGAAGLAQAAGQAGLSATVLRQAAGAAQASGNGMLAAQLSALAAGADQVSGGANLTGGAPGSLAGAGVDNVNAQAVLSVTVRLQAAGGDVAGGTANAQANSPGSISATGGAQSAGSATWSATVKLTAAGFVQAMGAGQWSATVSLSAFASASASGSATLAEVGAVLLVPTRGFSINGQRRNFSLSGQRRIYRVSS